MEQIEEQLEQKLICCPICYDVLKDPVTIACGHNYCMNCIKFHWDTEDERSIYSCPLCRGTLRQRPNLVKNTLLAHLVAHLNKSGLPAAPADDCYAGAEDVACAVCTDRKLKALKSCMVCLASYCGKHLEPHYKTPPFKKHKLVDPTVSLKETPVDALLSQTELKTRAEFLQYSQDITLDPKTAYKHLFLSEGNRKVTLIREENSYSSHPDRFTSWLQVLSRESLTGRCYWEVEWRGEVVHVAVSYKNIHRAGDSDECVFGYNNKSWSFRCEQNRCYLYCNNTWTKVLCGASPRVGVYLDHSVGLLSLYRISDTMTPLHRVQTTFTEPLYAGIRFYSCPGSTAEFCKLT
ncbi:E3 ubiquitin-protein ligase TRIM16-like [Solea solea]|uniref:E3 ubiquitin-protein ligase TRIM16-like n=1 Tax=Solea solea TaxID=90069 RepID=UPI00272C82D5|nr:E3 ubiquitin-protein ligase TRIM16-like [Solea solea]